MFKKLLILSVMCLIGVNAFAVPALQLYMPGATYYEVSPWFPETGETWITMDNPFELWVVGGSKNGGINRIFDVTLYMSILDTDYVKLDATINDPLITIKSIDFGTVYEKELLISGFTVEKLVPDVLNKHGIYPAHYASILLPDLLVGIADEDIYDYQPTGDISDLGTDKGDIQSFVIDYDPILQFIHFDLTGSYYKDEDKDKITLTVAPYSHDADVLPGVIPEPATILLMLSGLLGMFGIKFGRKKV
ncbi:MAG: choice-of-anchor N protein [Candidatus Omnitrophica bacterium]|nr:choice-of-anchor N protein [Candidatus Omnitrophota bacterium]